MKQKKELAISTNAHSEIADFGSDQGRSDFETGGVAALR
jgi:hypothetical protein